jgi:adapter protein MecA 1/2
MEFRKDEKNRIHCVITEEEIEDLGYSIDEIISNGARTQEFMNRIFDMAEDELQMKFDMGIKTVRADLLPDHTLSLTFSSHPASEGVFEHIKDIVNGLMNSIPQQKWEELTSQKEASQDIAKDGQARIVVLLAFEEMDTMIRFAKQVPLSALPFNELYKFEGTYFLMMDLYDCKEEDVKKLSAIIDEYATDVFVGSEKRAFIYEHGKVIIKEGALEQLRLI